MIERDELTVIPNIKNPSKLAIHYKTSGNAIELEEFSDKERIREELENE